MRATPQQDEHRRETARTRALVSVCGVLATVCTVLAVGRGVGSAATDSADLQIGASIGIRCTLITQPLSFGIYDPMNAAPRDVNGNISLNCSQSFINFIMHLRLGQGLQPAAGSTTANPLRQMSNGTGGLMRYDIYRNAPRTQVWGDTFFTAVFPGFGPYPMNIPVYGRIPPLQSTPPGSYSDDVNATLWF